MLAILLIILISASAILWIASRTWRVNRRREQLTQTPFPHAWRAILKKRIPFFRSLPADLQLQLKKHIQVFIAEKQFVGCDGLEIDDDIRVTVAAQACLLLLNRKTDFYPHLKEILIYPSVFIVNNEQRDSNGLVSERRRVLSGESWQHSKVILSWQTAKEGAAVPNDGSNVVIHEFAHQLDQEDGHANGAPILTHSQDYASWSTVMMQEYQHLVEASQSQQYSLFSYYGATNPAEFFAVISEVFFEQPHDFLALHTALYNELSSFYKLDPVNWH
ncbi:zinc-dependent peptidase [Shewanella sp. KX20019]|uniref:M90 family metallopeptidase n=1 Tax=Shewanella sp. KX20019 TaxID=2803864 RepID=UPI00192937E9|nr:M90 family metallopeptidase [Shewanella sp. KX20019]QQX81699.1 zinc-dependent peptidase [Shewanella sp. KX20019]